MLQKCFRFDPIGAGPPIPVLSALFTTSNMPNTYICVFVSWYGLFCGRVCASCVSFVNIRKGLYKTIEKKDLSHDIQSLTQHAHTNACYCDKYSQIGA